VAISDCLSLCTNPSICLQPNQNPYREHAKIQETVKRMRMSPIKPAYLLNFLCTKVRTQRAQACTPILFLKSNPACNENSVADFYFSSEG